MEKREDLKMDGFLQRSFAVYTELILRFTTSAPQILKVHR